jgi:ankyrin repeat protein
MDRFIGHCMRADAAAARELLTAHPDLLVKLADEDRAAIADAAGHGRVDSVRLMVDFGFDLGWEGSWCGTPLHHAAWHGNPELASLLIELGAPVNARDRTFGSSPIGWAAHGSANCRSADDDYVAVVDVLLEAGSDYEASVNRWGQDPAAMASPRVAGRMKERGFGSSASGL